MKRTKKRINGRKLLWRLLVACVVESLAIVILIVILIVNGAKVNSLNNTIETLEEQVNVEAIEEDKTETWNKEETTNVTTEAANEEISSLEPTEENREASFCAGTFAIKAISNSESEKLRASYEMLEAEVRRGSVSIETLKSYNDSILATFGEGSNYLIDMNYKFDATAWWRGKCYAEFDAQIVKAYQDGNLSDVIYEEYQNKINSLSDRVSDEGYKELIQYCFDFIIENQI